MTYKPTEYVERMLNGALEEVKGVPYDVSLRWVFYQMVQNHGFAKTDYNKFKGWASKARKSFWNGWRPDTLVDDSRKIAFRGGGHDTPAEWRKSFMEQDCVLSKRAEQENIVLVLYEAEAMSQQFQYHLGDLYVTSAPFKGDASIRHKWNIAAWLAREKKQYPDKPVRLLYFGDLDPKGLEIPISALKDIYPWFTSLCEVVRGKIGSVHRVDDQEIEGYMVWESKNKDFRFERVGLTEGQAEEFEIEDNPEKPGTYQWEALSDEHAENLILTAVREYWDESINEGVEEKEEEAQAAFREKLREVIESIEE